MSTVRLPDSVNEMIYGRNDSPPKSAFVPDVRVGWDTACLELAEFWANKRSKDPSTKVGAVIKAPDHSIISLGYNGLPRGIGDNPHRLNDRTVKYPLTIHAETNAILTAKQDLRGSTLYCTHPCCVQCAVKIIQVGIARVVTRPPTPAFLERWSADYGWSKSLFIEAGIHCVEIPYA